MTRRPTGTLPRENAHALPVMGAPKDSPENRERSTLPETLPGKRLLSVLEAAAYLDVSDSLIYLYIERGIITPVRLPSVSGRTFRGMKIDRRELDSLVDRCREVTHP